jgi:hypothetical protein
LDAVNRQSQEIEATVDDKYRKRLDIYVMKSMGQISAEGGLE